jgi:hypothetical protein
MQIPDMDHIKKIKKIKKNGINDILFVKDSLTYFLTLDQT